MMESYTPGEWDNEPQDWYPGDDDPAELELEDRAELAEINGQYPDVEAFYASRHKDADNLIQGDGTGFGEIWGVQQFDLSKPLPFAAAIAEDEPVLEPWPPGVPRQDIIALLHYNWTDEEADFNMQDEDGKIDHIFLAMRRINNWITG
jgi:hypothetical protein